MASTRFIFFIFSNIMLLVTTQSIDLQQPFVNHVCSNDKGNYTADSTYQKDLNTLLTALLASSNNSNGYGFYNSTLGRDPNQVHAIGHCRGDISANDCRNCLNDSRVVLTELCPNQKEAIGWKDICMLRYSHRSIYGVMETDPNFPLFNAHNMTSLAPEFMKRLERLILSLRVQAASSGPLRKFSVGNTSIGASQTLYGFAQCTPDLSEKDCSDCLQGAFGTYTENGKVGCRVFRPSCNIQCETSSFIETANVVPLPSTSPVSPPEPSSTNTAAPGGSKGNKTRTVNPVVIIVVAATLVALIISISVFLGLRKRKKKLHRKLLPAGEDEEFQNSEAVQFDFGTIRVATDNFSEANKLGQGGFGPVYKGRLVNGDDIAVKRLSINSGQGDLEFKNEVLLMAKLQHRNLVRLLGFCLERYEKLLVYEFVPNTSLDRIIFDRIQSAQLDWDKRYKIIEGISRGLLYLHQDSRLRIIHRDLKASNILIDAEMNAKISDFGMARLFGVDQTQGNTSRIVGTYGYMAPEYVLHGHFSVKSDVYSFGVLILEMVTGQKNSCFRQGEDFEDLRSYAWKSFREGTALNLIDPTLSTDSRNEIMRCIHIGLLCVQKNVADRPTMASIIFMFNTHSLSLPVPSQPAFFMHSDVESDMPWGRVNNSEGTTGSDQSTSKSVKASKNGDSLITQVYSR